MEFFVDWTEFAVTTDQLLVYLSYLTIVYTQILYLNCMYKTFKEICNNFRCRIINWNNFVFFGSPIVNTLTIPIYGVC